MGVARKIAKSGGGVAKISMGSPLHMGHKEVINATGIKEVRGYSLRKFLKIWLSEMPF